MTDIRPPNGKLAANYGLFFNVWDRLLGTNHTGYEERFGRVTAPRSA